RDELGPGRAVRLLHDRRRAHVPAAGTSVGPARARGPRSRRARAAVLHRYLSLERDRLALRPIRHPEPQHAAANPAYQPGLDRAVAGRGCGSAVHRHWWPPGTVAILVVGHADGDVRAWRRVGDRAIRLVGGRN